MPTAYPYFCKEHPAKTILGNFLLKNFAKMEILKI
jgi:hypothetical protein